MTVTQPGQRNVVRQQVEFLQPGQATKHCAEFLAIPASWEHQCRPSIIDLGNLARGDGNDQFLDLTSVAPAVDDRICYALYLAKVSNDGLRSVTLGCIRGGTSTPASMSAYSRIYVFGGSIRTPSLLAEASAQRSYPEAPLEVG